jgi:hypothetical protein
LPYVRIPLDDFECFEGVMGLKIDCYISESCSSEAGLRENLDEALRSEAVTAEVSFQRISERDAKRLNLMGSPTVLIDNVDILPGDIPGIS